MDQVASTDMWTSKSMGLGFKGLVLILDSNS
jgi:hypothetical protein